MERTKSAARRREEVRDSWRDDARAAGASTAVHAGWMLPPFAHVAACDSQALMSSATPAEAARVAVASTMPLMGKHGGRCPGSHTTRTEPVTTTHCESADDDDDAADVAMTRATTAKAEANGASCCRATDSSTQPGGDASVSLHPPLPVWSGAGRS